MGDSSVSCVLSGIGMWTDRVAFLVLAPAAFVESGRNTMQIDRGSRTISNNGPRAYYSPFLFPIFGNLDGYGRLEDIDRDDHVTFLEKKTGATIDEIVEAASEGTSIEATRKIAEDFQKWGFDSEFKNETKWDGTLSGCFVHEKVWKKFSKFHISDSGHEDYLMYDRFLNQEILKKIGFRGESHPDLPGVTYQEREYKLKVESCIYESVYSARAMQEKMMLHGKSLPQKALQWLLKTPESASAVSYYLNKLGTSLAQGALRKFTLLKDDSPPEAVERYREWIEKVSKDIFSDHREERKEAPRIPDGTKQYYGDGLHLICVTIQDGKATNPCVVESNIDYWEGRLQTTLHQSVRITEELIKSVIPEYQVPPALPCTSGSILLDETAYLYGYDWLRTHKRSLCKLHDFDYNMAACNRLYMPSYCGFQYGNHYAKMAVDRFSMKIMKKKIRS